MNDRTPKVYLSRRNLIVLLAKLDFEAAGGETACTIVKNQHTSPEYRQTMQSVAIIAVEDDVYYGAQQRAPGQMHPREEASIAPKKSQ